MVMHFATGNMDLAAHRCKPKYLNKVNELNAVGIGLNPDTILIIRLPDSRFLRIVSQSLFLAMVLLTLPALGSIWKASSNAVYESDVESADLIGFEALPILSTDLAGEGLLKKGQKGLIVSASGIGRLIADSDFMKDNDINLATESDLNREDIVPSENFDFVCMLSSGSIAPLDRVLKVGGIVVTQLGNDASSDLQNHPNYKIVYLRRFKNTIIAMKKIRHAQAVNSATEQTLCGVTPQAKKAALEGLEDVMLEPPRRALAKSRKGSRKINFLPDLSRDSLESYPRRVFISDDKNNAAVEWFLNNYPTRNQHFDVYQMDIEIFDMQGPIKGAADSPAGGTSDWFRKNVKKEDFVVMKADALVVEEMVKDKTICLVDELFLECKDQQQDGRGDNQRKIAYWQCIALYGKLRDEGLAVHQWWP